MSRFQPIQVGIDTCFLVESGERRFLVDGGAPDKGKEFLRGLEAIGVEPRSIETILLTHGHADYIGSLAFIRAATGAKVVCHAADAGWVRSGTPPLPPGITPWGQGLIGLATYMYKPRIKPCPVDVAFTGDFSLSEYGMNDGR